MADKIIRFIKEWFLVIGMTVGVLAYLAYDALPSIHAYGPVLHRVCKIVQPLLLFVMLFLSFCKVRPSELKPHRWQFWLLLIQSLSFIGIALLVCWADSSSGNVAAFINNVRQPLEAAMLCLICPTATACAVMTGKLGGNVAEVVTYTIIINFAVAILIPLFVPLVHPDTAATFLDAFLKILYKVFPLLILPFIAAMAVRFLLPRLHSWLVSKSDLAFYIWGISLTLAITMSTREIMHSSNGLAVILETALASLLTCIFQFAAGRAIGRRYGCEISASQALGQKNTVFAIWVGYTFLTPAVSVAGGFYSIWHNVYNSWQLHRHQKRSHQTRS